MDTGHSVKHINLLRHKSQFLPKQHSAHLRWQRRPSTRYSDFPMDVTGACFHALIDPSIWGWSFFTTGFRWTCTPILSAQQWQRGIPFFRPRLVYPTLSNEGLLLSDVSQQQFSRDKNPRGENRSVMFALFFWVEVVDFASRAVLFGTACVPARPCMDDLIFWSRPLHDNLYTSSRKCRHEVTPLCGSSRCRAYFSAAARHEVHRAGSIFLPAVGVSGLSLLAHQISHQEGCFSKGQYAFAQRGRQPTRWRARPRAQGYLLYGGVVAKATHADKRRDPMLPRLGLTGQLFYIWQNTPQVPTVTRRCARTVARSPPWSWILIRSYSAALGVFTNSCWTQSSSMREKSTS